MLRVRALPGRRRVVRAASGNLQRGEMRHRRMRRPRTAVLQESVRRDGLHRARHEMRSGPLRPLRQERRRNLLLRPAAPARRVPREWADLRRCVHQQRDLRGLRPGRRALLLRQSLLGRRVLQQRPVRRRESDLRRCRRRVRERTLSRLRGGRPDLLRQLVRAGIRVPHEYLHRLRRPRPDLLPGHDHRRSLRAGHGLLDGLAHVDQPRRLHDLRSPRDALLRGPRVQRRWLLLRRSLHRGRGDLRQHRHHHHLRPVQQREVRLRKPGPALLPERRPDKPGTVREPRPVLRQHRRRLQRTLPALRPEERSLLRRRRVHRTRHQLSPEQRSVSALVPLSGRHFPDPRGALIRRTALSIGCLAQPGRCGRAK